MGGVQHSPLVIYPMLSLWIEHAEAMAVQLVLYDIQVYMRIDNKDLGEITIWLDNDEVLSRARRRNKGSTLSDAGTGFQYVGGDGVTSGNDQIPHQMGESGLPYWYQILQTRSHTQRG